ncbi:MAG: phosphatase PAP2 family protein, partial [Anaerohalosphaera sp.]|nr:phosphatase PAP2 family protein [Anaerohalosphaera sp.]
LNIKWIDEGIYQVGGPGFHFAATGIWYVVSDYSGDELNKQRAWTMMKALSVTGFSTISLKLIRDNDTPNGKWLGWPSGHTSSSFTVAAVLDEFYGPRVGIPAYIGAGFVGYRMMDSGDHWASDVLFGAVMGYIVGHHVAGDGADINLAGFELKPYMDHQYGQRRTGLNLYKRF